MYSPISSLQGVIIINFVIIIICHLMFKLRRRLLCVPVSSETQYFQLYLQCIFAWHFWMSFAIRFRLKSCADTGRLSLYYMCIPDIH